jgi:putative DNA primase/helicase
VERLLSISGEDILTVDRKYREPWSGSIPARFVIISNELPRFGDASGAIASRFIVLTLRGSWLGREDPDLTRSLLKELPGIFEWALDGLERLHGQGRFTEPVSSIDATTALADLVSPTSAFVRECCVTGPGEAVPCDGLYEAWRTWAEENGHHAGSSQTFGRNLRAVVPDLRTGRPRSNDHARCYQGVSLMASGHGRPVRGPARTTGGANQLVPVGPRTNAPPHANSATAPMAMGLLAPPARGAEGDDGLEGRGVPRLTAGLPQRQPPRPDLETAVEEDYPRSAWDAGSSGPGALS